MKWLRPRFTHVSWQFRVYNTKRDCPQLWQKCLESPLSLTKKLETLFPDSIEIYVLQEGWQKIICRRKKLGWGVVKPRQYSWIRKVLIASGGIPLLLAKTTIPLKATKGRLRLVRHLGNKALGKLLYREPSLKRTRIDIYPISCKDWGRNSQFLFAGSRLFLEEYFLPDLLHKILQYEKEPQSKLKLIGGVS